MKLCNQFITQLYTRCHLFINDITPSAATVTTDLVEATFTGYEPQNIQGWTPAILRSGKAITWSDPIRFTCAANGPLQTVYGYYVTLGYDGPLLWLERRAMGPIPIANIGDLVIVLPSLTLSP